MGVLGVQVHAAAVMCLPRFAAVVLIVGLGLALRPSIADAAHEPPESGATAEPNAPASLLSSVRVNGVTLHYQSRGKGSRTRTVPLSTVAVTTIRIPTRSQAPIIQQSPRARIWLRLSIG
jgi:hypothetical protein